MNPATAINIYLEPADNRRLANLCGQYDEHLRQVERHLDVEINNRGNHFFISGKEPAAISAARNLLQKLYRETAHQNELNPAKIHLFLQQKDTSSVNNHLSKTQELQESEADNMLNIHTKAGVIKAYTPNQLKYLQNILKYDINFSIGPAGTGKTYLAVAAAVSALEKAQTRRVLLVRPAVEAGENLGFLPGDFMQKIEPYLRPLYDALFEMLGFEQVRKLIEQNIIEIAPLAYMRGRTLNESFIILDESQNTTPEQMQMFLTRIGFGSKAIITGDITQIDLPKGKKCGLMDAAEVLRGVEGICFNYFDSKDVVRHALVQRIVEAYSKSKLSESVG